MTDKQKSDWRLFPNNTHGSPHHNTKYIGDYLVGKTLGQGTFAKVKLGVHKTTKQKVALKLIDLSKAKSNKDRDNVNREIKLLQLLDHPNIVKLYDVIHIAEKNTTCLVLEFVEGGELFDYIVANKKIREAEAINFFRQVLSAVEYCHSNLVIHRDLKPENLLLDSSKNIKVNDFGLSNMMRPGDLLRTFCGSPLYSSPEIILETNYVGPEVDVWALGVILYAMVCGYLPWDGDDLRTQMTNAVHARYDMPSHVSPECKDLIQRMITIDPKKRATIQEVRTHPWVSKGLKGPPPSCLPVRAPIVSTMDIDQEILMQLIDMGFSKSDVIGDLLNNRTKPTTVTYYLIFDQKQRNIAKKELAAQKEREEKEKKEHPPPKVQETAKEESNKIETAEKPKRRRNSLPPQLTPLKNIGAVKVSELECIAEEEEEEPETVVQRPSTAPGKDATKLGWKENPTPRGELFYSAPIMEESSPRGKESVTTKIGKTFMGLFTKSKDSGDQTKESTVEPTVIYVGEKEEGDAPTGRTATRRGSFDVKTVRELEISQSKTAAEDKNLPVVKGAFSVETTTTKPAAYVSMEIERVLEAFKIDFKKSKKTQMFVCKVTDFESGAKISFEMEICKIEKLEGLRGIRCKRLAGDVWTYKETMERILREMKL